MPRQNTIQTNFSSGEVSPKITGRIDTKIYSNGVATLENMIVLPQGGLTRRGGSEYGDWTRRNSSQSRLIPFRYSDTDAFQAEVGDYYIRILRNFVPVLNSTSMYSAISAVATSSGQVRITFTNENRISCTEANSGGLIRITTALPHNLLNGDSCYFSGEFGIFTISYVSSTVFDLVGSTYAGPYASPFVVTSNLVSGSSSSGGLIKITTVLPHLLDTGDKIYMAHRTPGVDFSATPAVFDWVVTVVDDTSFTLDSSVYTAGSDTRDDTFVKWIKNDQRVVITGSGGSQNLSGTWRAIQSTARDFLVLANSTFVGATVGTYNLYFDHINVNAPWPESALSEITYRQSADVLYLMHPDYATRKLVRFSDDSWTLQTVDFQDGPYLPLQVAAPSLNTVEPDQGSRFLDVYMQLSGYTHTATVTVGAGGTAFNTADDNLYIEYRDGDQWRLAQLPGTVATNDTTATVSIIDNVLLFMDETIKFKNTVGPERIGGFPNQSVRVYDAGSPNASPSVPAAGVRQRVDPNNFLAGDQSGAGAGTLASNYSNTFGQADVGKYVRYMDATAHGASAGRVARWAQIVRIGATGASASHSAAVTMASNNSAGNFVITNDTRSATLTSYKAGAAFAMFASTDVGRLIRLGWAGRWCWGKITAFTSSSVVTVALYSDVPRDPHNAANLAGALVGAITVSSSLVTGLTTGRTYDWRLGAWSDTTGYASSATFHEQRLIFARSNTQPSTFWGSVTGDFENFAPTELDSTVLDDNGFTYTIASGLVQAIKWMESSTNLVLGTNSGEWIARSSSATQEPITPSNIAVIQQSSNGSSTLPAVHPIRSGNRIQFVNRSNRMLMEVGYLFSEDRLEDKDLTIAAEHIFRRVGTVTETAYQQYPHGVSWFLMSDGSLVALTYNADQEIIAWHRHEITDAEIESICVTPNSAGTADTLGMICKRTNGGVTKRMIEFLPSDFYAPTSGSSRLGQRFLDTYTLVENYAGTTISGLYHLEGHTVIVTGNGTQLSGTFTISSGAVSIGATAYSEVLIGKAFTPDVESLPLEGGSDKGTSHGMKKRLVEMKLRVFETAEFDVYPVSRNASTDKVNYNKSTASQQFFTGMVPIVPKSPYEQDTAWRITTEKPYALTILAAGLVIETNE